nr:hypothetical protein Itr_chr01CG22660 [Ipomoea trifida]
MTPHQSSLVEYFLPAALISSSPYLAREVLSLQRAVSDAYAPGWRVSWHDFSAVDVIRERASLSSIMVPIPNSSCKQLTFACISFICPELGKGLTSSMPLNLRSPFLDIIRDGCLFFLVIERTLGRVDFGAAGKSLHCYGAVSVLKLS